MSALINVSITVENDEQINNINSLETKAYFDIFDERYRQGKKEAWALKNQYGARLNPFAEIKVNGKFYQVLYSEASDVIKDLKQSLKQIQKISNTLSA